MTRKLTDKQVLSKVGLILCNEAEFWRGMDYQTARKLQREYRSLSRRLFEMAAKKRSPAH